MASIIMKLGIHLFVVLVLLVTTSSVAIFGAARAHYGVRPYSSPLRFGFYSYSCPQAESLVRNVSKQVISNDKTLAPSLLRLHFHDCFVRGCDGSILLNSTSPATNPAERDSLPNLSLRGFAAVDQAKAILEDQCPGIVSCADIVALMARDSVYALGGPYYAVELGRRDGVVSLAAEALANLPAPFFNYTQLKARFLGKGLSVQDLVVLSGAHTVGFSSCGTIHPRLYNFTGHSDTDPSLQPTYAAYLKTLCSPDDFTTRIPMDSDSELVFDTHYFSGVMNHRGLFSSDAALLTNPQSRSLLRSEILFRGRFPFFAEFPNSMRAMGSIGVLTGGRGRIRSLCAVA